MQTPHVPTSLQIDISAPEGNWWCRNMFSFWTQLLLVLSLICNLYDQYNGYDEDRNEMNVEPWSTLWWEWGFVWQICRVRGCGWNKFWRLIWPRFQFLEGSPIYESIWQVIMIRWPSLTIETSEIFYMKSKFIHQKRWNFKINYFFALCSEKKYSMFQVTFEMEVIFVGFWQHLEMHISIRIWHLKMLKTNVTKNL